MAAPEQFPGDRERSLRSGTAVCITEIGAKENLKMEPRRPFDLLPPEMISPILFTAAGGSADALCRLGMVCKQFGELIKGVESIHWQFHSSSVSAKAKSALLFLESATNVRDMSIVWTRNCFNGPSLSTTFLVGALAATPHLESLQITYWDGLLMWGQMADDLLLNLARLCPSIEVLKLGLQNARLKRALNSCSESFSNLKIVHLSEFGLSDIILRSLTECCTVLETLSLVRCKGLRAPHIKSSSLKNLVLSNVREDDEGDFKGLVIDAPNLAKLSLSVVPRYTNVKAPKLQTLILGDMYFNSRGDLVTQTLPWSLEHLECNGSWRVAHLKSVLVACKEINTLKFGSGFFAVPAFHTGNVKDSSSFDILEGLGRVREVESACWERFVVNGSRAWELVPSNQFRLERIHHIRISFNDPWGAHMDLDISDLDLCKHLIAMSTNLEQLDLLVNVKHGRHPRESLRRLLDSFKEEVTNKWPCLQVTLKRA